VLEWSLHQWRDHTGLTWQEYNGLRQDAKIANIGRNPIQDFADSLLEKHLNKQPFDLPLFAFYDAERGAKEAHGPKAVPDPYYLRFGAYAKAHKAGISFPEAIGWFNRNQHEALKNHDAPEKHLLDAVKQAVHTLLPQIQSLDFQPTANRLTARFASPAGALVELPVSRLSHGYQGMLALVMDFARRLAQANPHLPNPLEAEAICLIDEVDLHFHPEWQQRVVPDLLKVFPRTQFILTTHSPQVLTTVEAANIFIVEKGGVRSCPAPTYGASSADVVSEVLGLRSLRPPNNPIASKISALFEAIDDSDLGKAKAVRAELNDWAKGFPEPDLVRADLMIRRLEVKENGKNAARP